MKQSEILYKGNKIAKVGTEIICPICCKSFTKRQYPQAFCCTDCKDKYWNKKGDRHSSRYYSDYNITHPERLDRGYTKGYNNGNVSDGIKEKHNTNIWYDTLGHPHSNNFFNPTLSDLLYHKCFVEWHDDDWEESNWDD